MLTFVVILLILHFVAGVGFLAYKLMPTKKHHHDETHSE